LIYSYKITFGISEKVSVDISKLNKNHTVDIKELLYILKEDSEVYVKYHLKENPNISNIKKAIKYSNNISKKNNTNIIKSITCIRTFSFWIYIFIWFILTYIYSNLLIQYIIEKISLIFKYFYY